MSSRRGCENGGQEADGEVVGQCREGVQAQEKQVLDDDGGAQEKGGTERWGFFETRPGQVDVKQQEENPQAKNGTLKTDTDQISAIGLKGEVATYIQLIIIASKPIEQQMSVNLVND